MKIRYAGVVGCLIAFNVWADAPGVVGVNPPSTVMVPSANNQGADTTGAAGGPGLMGVNPPVSVLSPPPPIKRNTDQANPASQDNPPPPSPANAAQPDLSNTTAGPVQSGGLPK